MDVIVEKYRKCQIYGYSESLAEMRPLISRPYWLITSKFQSAPFSNNYE